MNIKNIFIGLVAFLISASPVYATTLFPSGGGTGSTTLSGILIGNGQNPVQTLKIGTNLTLIGTTLNASGGGSGGSGSIGTSSPGVKGSLLYYTTAGATPELVAPVATTSLSGTGGISVSNAPFVIGGTPAVVSCASCILSNAGDWAGTWQTFSPSHFQTALGFTAVPNTRNINTTYPVTGGGDLSADRTIALAFGTSTSNTWGGVQTFSSTPILGSLSGLVAGNSGALYGVSTTSMNASITGNAGTATALAANGTNCSAGNYPLGVDASGNSESCTAVPAAIWPWNSLTNFGTTTIATTTPLFEVTGLMASSTSQFVNLNVWGTLKLNGLNNSVLSTDASGNVSATSSIGTNFLSGALLATNFPALTGDITTSAGSLATALKSTGTAGTYRSTTFDAQGRETSGTNPTTFSGYAISDTSANLAAALTDETGTGKAVFSAGPTFTLTANFTNASSSVFSNFGTAFFGGSATTTIDASGNLVVAGNTTLANATSSNLFSTTASSTNLFAQTASFGTVTLPVNGTAAGSFVAFDTTGKLISTTTPATGSGTVGSGVIGQLPYYAESGTTLTATSSLFLSTAGYLGIGTTSPLRPLTVQSPLNISPVQLIDVANDDGNVAVNLRLTHSVASTTPKNGDGNAITFNIASSTPDNNGLGETIGEFLTIVDGNNKTGDMEFLPSKNGSTANTYLILNGNLGTAYFGTSTPTTNALSVQNLSNVTNAVQFYSNTGAPLLALSNVGALKINQLGSGAVSAASGVLSAGTLSLANGGTATTTGGVTNGVYFYNGTYHTNSSLLQFNGSNLSIGTTTFGTLLNINGFANFAANATSSIYSPLQFFGTQFAGNYASSTTASGIISVNWNQGNNQRFILSGATSFVINSTSSDPIDGGRYLLKICQDGTGSRAVTFLMPGGLVWSLGTTTVSSAANTGTMIGMVYDGRSARYDILASSTISDTRTCVP